ncbi:hypothetical protein HYFRA_00002181 [Hymenoscyphus fraxineus]|uniref:N-acetyltransferase domain-containing protein n=1 Tax=Hymenoscyphus fraxineus TaxID=746836 RepID=A0A9N9KN66_9HELO|nr:hypothetical protein HYFRA_00002181 [Hymenoscyphus fraxineus]
MSVSFKEKSSNPVSLDPNPRTKVLLRRGNISDFLAIGRIAAHTYGDTYLDAYLSPHSKKHPNAFRRGYQQRALQRMLSPRNLTFVAVEESNPRVVVGYAQFTRLGEDEGAQKQIASRKGFLMPTALWLWNFILPFLYWVDRGKCDDPDAVAEFLRVGDEEARFWFERYPMRRNRWHAQSVVVLRHFQGMGIGKRLMGEVIKRAGEENVPVGIEASSQGEMLYRSVGFELLSRFRPLKGMKGDNEGGIFMWKPSGWIEANDVVEEKNKSK